ncbi:MAG TPA: LysR family transcriptional regulator [Tissierellia bacterium]|nr:LysR family transcriptional regulator [Tissierellia bacterium]
MTLEYLRYLKVIAQTGSINKASKELFLSQPHLSNIVRNIEEELQIRIFKRLSSGVQLTPEGDVLLTHVSKLLYEFDQLQAFHPRKTSPIGLQMRIAMTKFSHTMESFQAIVVDYERKNTFEHRLIETSSRGVIQAIHLNKADVGVIHYGKEQEVRVHALVEAYELEYHELAHLQPHIVISKTHELIRQGAEITLESLDGYGFVRYWGEYEDFVYDIASEATHKDLNESPNIVYVEGRAALLHLIGNSNFYTIGIREFLSQDEVYKVISIPIETEDLITFSWIKRRSDRLNSITEQFVEELTRTYSRL